MTNFNISRIQTSPIDAQKPGTSRLSKKMIMAAIRALNAANGSNKSSISRQIEATYEQLPQAHSTLLTHHLQQMKQTNQLTLFKNNYLILDPDSAPRRGRGRPPKAKSSNTPAAPTGPPRPRGRHPKIVDPNASPPAPKSKGTESGRGRGRPPKAKTESSSVMAPAAVAGVKRGRGRPPKAKVAVAV